MVLATVGLRTAQSIAAEIADITRSDSSGSPVRHAGINPRVEQSGNVKKHGKLKKGGPRCPETFCTTSEREDSMMPPALARTKAMEQTILCAGRQSTVAELSSSTIGFDQPVSMTALINAAARAQECERPDPLVRDVHAKSLAGDKGRELLERFGKFFTTIEAVRAKFFDDSICKAVSEGIRQIVMLGAGLDARPYRLSCLGRRILWVDVDYEPVLLYKGRVLQNAKPLCEVVNVGKDIRDADLAQVLAEGGVNLGLSILWVAEGVFQYLKEPEVEDILARLRASSAPGSEIIFNAQNKANLVRTQHNAKMLDLLDELGTPWTFTTESPADLLDRHGFDPKIVFLGHAQAHYGRLPWPPSDSPATGFPCEWLATGHVKG